MPSLVLEDVGSSSVDPQVSPVLPVLSVNSILPVFLSFPFWETFVNCHKLSKSHLTHWLQTKYKFQKFGTKSATAGNAHVFRMMRIEGAFAEMA